MSLFDGPAVYLLALVPAVVWGFTPVLAKRGIEAGGNSMQATVTDLTVDAALFWVILLVIRSPDHLFDGVTPMAAAVFVFGGVVGTTVGRLGTFVGVDKVGASVANAALSTRPMFAAVFAWGLIGESFGSLQVIGILVLVAGLIVISFVRGDDEASWEGKLVVIPVIAAVSFAIGNVARRYGLDQTATTVLQATTINETAALIALLAYVIASGDRRPIRAPARTYPYFVLHGALTVIAVVALFEAFDRLPVIIVDPLYATAPLFTIIFTLFLLRGIERITLRTVAGALCIVAGAVLVTL